MKKLLLGLLLAFTLCVSAQTEQFMRQYENCIYIEEGKDNVEVKQTSRFFFNYSNSPDKIRLIYGNKVYDLVRIGEIETGKSVSGYEYQSVMMVDEAGDEILVQLFDKEYTCRIIMSEITIEFY